LEFLILLISFIVVSCTVWEGLEVKKADLSVLDVAAAIIAKVDVMPESTDYLCGGMEII